MYSKVFPVKHQQKLWPPKSNISRLQSLFRQKKSTKTGMQPAVGHLYEYKKTYKTDRNSALYAKSRTTVLHQIPQRRTAAT